MFSSIIGNNDSNFHVLLISITAVIYFANVLYQIPGSVFLYKHMFIKITKILRKNE